MGAILARAIAGTILPGSVEPLATSGIALSEPIRLQFAAALHSVFLAGLAASGAGLLGTLFLPPLDMTPRVSAATGERLIEAEMATLLAEDEPVVATE